MAAVDFLPIAQPAARPDAAADRKPVSSDAGQDSFADVLKTEVENATKSDDAALKADTKPEPEAETDVSGQSAPPEAAAQAAPTQPTNAATVIAAVLQAPALVLQTQGATPAVEGEHLQAAPTPADAAAINTNTEIPVAAAPATPETAMPATVTAAPALPSAATATAPVTPEASARPSGQIAEGATEQLSPSQVKAESKANVGADMSISADDGANSPQADASTEALAAKTDDAATQPVKIPQQASAAPAAAAVAPPTDAAIVQAAASNVAAQTPPAKPTAPTHSENAPGHRRDAEGDANTLVAETAAATKPSAQQTQPAAASGQVSTGQAKPAAAQTAEAAMADVRADAAPAPPAMSTSTGSASFAETLAAARSNAADAARAPANQHLQSAPPATLQVYTRMIERFDGRAQRFEVRLDPAELGRVDVRIEVGADKKVHAVLAAHDSAALTDLMRGQRALERALNDAGIDIADNGIRFEMSQDSGRNFAGQQRGDGWSNEDMAHAWRGFATAEIDVDASAADMAAATRAYSRRSSRLDVVA